MGCGGGGEGEPFPHTQNRNFRKKKVQQGSSFRSKTTAINRSPDLRKKTYTNCFLGTYFRSFQVFLMRNSPRRKNLNYACVCRLAWSLKPLYSKYLLFGTDFRTDIGKVKRRVRHEPQDTHKPNIPPPTPEGPP